MGTTAATVHAAEAAPGEALHEVIMEIAINAQRDRQTLIVLRDANGALWLAEEDLALLRLRLPTSITTDSGGRRYRPIAAYAGAHVSIDERAQRVALDLPAADFLPNRLSSDAPGGLPLTRAAPGAFLNYQLSAQNVSTDRRLGAYTELGLFSPLGVLTSTAVGIHSNTERGAQRLETSFTHDFPERLQTLVVGDAISDGASWGNAVRFAGLSFGRNFALRPDLLTMPTLSATGTAVVPSTVDIFVNNQRVSSQDVAPGPFIVDRLPAMTGAGEMRVVVRDALGREQVLTQPFYASNRLLAADMTQYSFSLGKVRQNYAQSSADYGDWLGTASYRRALSPRLTLEAHVESLHDAATAAGLNAAVGLNRAGILNLTLVRGGDSAHQGWLGGLGYERVGARFSLTLATTVAQDDYRQLGDTAISGLRYRQRSVAQMGLNLGVAGSLALACVQQLYRTEAPLRTLSLTHSLVVRERAAISATVSHGFGAQSTTSAYLSATMALGPRRAVSVQLTDGSSSAQPAEVYVSTQQNAPAGPGVGYRVGVGSRGSYDAVWRAQSSVGDAELQGVRNQGVAGQSILWSGAATLLGGSVRAARAVNGSFALIDVGGIADVPVYVDHQLVAHTDRHGVALLHDLHAYEANRINVEPLELPLDSSIGARTVVLAPAFRSGVIARFPVVRERGVVFHLRLHDGAVVPAGAQAVVGNETLPVALDGVAYLHHHASAARGNVTWGSHECHFDLPSPTGDDPLPDLGDLPCSEVVK